MKIESLIKRNGGTFVDLPSPDTQYHFAPTKDDDRHVAEVTRENHIAMFLRVPNGFAAIDADPDELPKPPKLIGSLVHNASYPVHGGEDMDLDDVVQMAYESSALTIDEWNALDDQQRYEYIDNTIADLAFDPAARPPVIETPKPEDKPKPDETNDNAADLGDGADGDQGAGTGNGEDSEQTPAPAAPAPAEKPPATEKVTTGPVDDAAALEDARNKFKAVHGRFPSKQMKLENILNAIREDDE